MQHVRRSREERRMCKRTFVQDTFEILEAFEVFVSRESSFQSVGFCSQFLPDIGVTG